MIFNPVIRTTSETISAFSKEQPKVVLGVPQTSHPRKFLGNLPTGHPLQKLDIPVKFVGGKQRL